MGLRDVLIGVMVGGSLATGAVYAQDKIQAAQITRVDIYRGCRVDVHMGYRATDTDIDTAFGERGVVLSGTRANCAAQIKTWLDSGFQIQRVEGAWPAGMAYPWPAAPGVVLP